MSAASRLNVPLEKIGVVLVDHGSVVPQSNQLLVEIVDAYRRHGKWAIVEPAHMELAEPSIAAAFGRCVEQGAELVIVMPYFLGPGRHSSQDIPRLTAEAARAHSGIEYLVTGPLGLHEFVLRVVDERINEAIEAAER